VSMYLYDNESTDGGIVKVCIVAVVCCSSVLHYQYMTMSRLMVVLSRYVL